MNNFINALQLPNQAKHLKASGFFQKHILDTLA